MRRWWFVGLQARPRAWTGTRAKSTTAIKRPPTASVPTAVPPSLTFDGRSHVVVAGSSSFDMTNHDYTIYSSGSRPDAAGTITSPKAASAQIIGYPTASRFLIRGGRLSFDIGWVGLVESRTPDRRRRLARGWR